MCLGLNQLQFYADLCVRVSCEKSCWAVGLCLGLNQLKFYVELCVRVRCEKSCWAVGLCLGLNQLKFYAELCVRVHSEKSCCAVRLSVFRLESAWESSNTGNNYLSAVFWFVSLSLSLLSVGNCGCKSQLLVHIRLCRFVHTYVCMSVCLCVCLSVCMYVGMYATPSFCLYVFMWWGTAEAEIEIPSAGKIELSKLSFFKLRVVQNIASYTSFTPWISDLSNFFF